MTGRPELRWRTGADADSSVILLCRDAACAHVEATIAGRETAVLEETLARGSYWMRGYGVRTLADGTVVTSIFDSPTRIVSSTGQPARSAALLGMTVDLDRDGDAEVVLSNPGFHEDVVRIYRDGRSAEMDREPLRYGGGEAVLAGDADGDGMPELVVPETNIVDGGPYSDTHVNTTPTLFVFEYDVETRRFEHRQSIELEQPLFELRGVGDVDGDGYADIVASHHLPSTWTDPWRAVPSGVTLVILYGGPTGLDSRRGTLELRLPIAGRTLYTQVTVRGVGDVDADGCSDLAVQFPVDAVDDETTLPQLVEIRRGAAEEPFVETLARLDATSRVVPVGDVNGDGHPDLAAETDPHRYWPHPSNYASTVVAGSSRVILGGAQAPLVVDETFPNSRAAVPGCTSVHPSETPFETGLQMVGGADVDGDGFSDVIVRPAVVTREHRCEQPYGGVLGWRRGGTLGVSLLEVHEVASAHPDRPRRIHLPGDVGGDGYDDVVESYTPIRVSLDLPDLPGTTATFEGGAQGLGAPRQTSDWGHAVASGL